MFVQSYFYQINCVVDQNKAKFLDVVSFSLMQSVTFMTYERWPGVLVNGPCKMYIFGILIG